MIKSKRIKGIEIYTGQKLYATNGETVTVVNINEDTIDVMYNGRLINRRYEFIGKTLFAAKISQEGDKIVSELQIEKGIAFIRNKSEKVFKSAKQVLDSNTILPFLSQEQLLVWSEKITKEAATIYDKAMDAEYLRTHIGGGNHRLFDGGHDLKGAFEAVRNAKDDDTFMQEFLAYFDSLWNDITTQKGLPFMTVSQDWYNGTADWMTNLIPGISRDWIYDFFSYDVFELLGSALGIVGAVFALRNEDKERLAEILGSSGVVSVMSANPVMGVAMVAVAGYAYFVKKKEFDGKGFLKGSVLATVSITIFSILGLNIIVELMIVLVVTSVLRKQFDKDIDLREVIRKFYVEKVMPLGN